MTTLISRVTRSKMDQQFKIWEGTLSELFARNVCKIHDTSTTSRFLMEGRNFLRGYRKVNPPDWGQGYPSFDPVVAADLAFAYNLSAEQAVVQLNEAARLYNYMGAHIGWVDSGQDDLEISPQYTLF